MHIAIIGAGFSGVAAAWSLLQNPNVHVDLFDPLGVGGGASGIAAGLLHSYAGLHAKRNPQALEGYRASQQLLDIASQALGTPVYSASGSLRLALTHENLRDYTACAEKYDDVEWWTAEQCQRLVPGLPPVPGLYIRSTLTVNCPLYLQGLWKACQSKSACLLTKAVHSYKDLMNYDRIIICTGAAANKLLPHPLPFTQVKGQILELEWPTHLPPLKLPLNSQAYILMTPGDHTCIVGSTYERNFTTAEPDPDTAIREIMPKVAELYPPLKDAKVISCRAGVRASTPDHQPLLKQVDERCWVLAGMGSKGLLYHALYAQKLNELWTKWT